MLEAFATSTKLRAGQAKQAARSATLDSLKRSAAVYRDPVLPLRGMIDERAIRRTSSGIVLPSKYPSEEILVRAGGLSGFPAYQVYNTMLRHRFGDTMFPASDNDMVDEWHAAHAPYVDTIALDRRTAARLRGTKLSAAHKAVATLEELASRLEPGPEEDQNA